MAEHTIIPFNELPIRLGIDTYNYLVEVDEDVVLHTQSDGEKTQWSILCKNVPEDDEEQTNKIARLYVAWIIQMRTIVGEEAIETIKNKLNNNE